MMNRLLLGLSEFCGNDRVRNTANARTRWVGVL
jgi:hypothetical protein